MINTTARTMFDISQRVTVWDSKDNSRWKDLVKRGLYSYCVGQSVLERIEGSQQLANDWSYYEWKLSHTGRVGAVLLPDGNLEMIDGSQILWLNGVDLKKATETSEQNGLGTYFAPLDTNSNFQYLSMKALIHQADGSVQEVEFQKDKFAICDNTIDGMPDLVGIDWFLDRLCQIMEAIAYDMEMSKKKLIFLTPEKPAGKDWGEMLAMWKVGVFAYVYFRDSGTPTAEGLKEGRTGFDMTQVQHVVYEPRSDQRKQLWEDWNFLWEQMLWTYGIRFAADTDKERENVLETKNATDYFTCREREKKNCRTRFIRKVEQMLKTDTAPTVYVLHYGRA